MVPTGTLHKVLVSSLNRRSLVSDENKQKFLGHSGPPLPNKFYQKNKIKHVNIHPWAVGNTCIAGSLKLQASPGNKERYRICLGNIAAPLSAIYPPEPEPHISTMPPQSSVTFFALLSSETSHPAQLPPPTFSDLSSISWLKCLGGAYRRWKEISCPFQYCCQEDIRYEPSQRNGKKKPLEVRVWINFKFALDQPRSFSPPLKVVNDGARSQSSIPVMHEEYS